MEHPSLVPLEKCSDSVRKVGAKATQLALLARAGVPVPITWVLDAEPFRNAVETALPPGHDPHSLLRLTRDRVRLERSAQARERILETPLPAELHAALSWLWAELAPISPWGLAVRASATTEDESVAVMAGLATAVVGVRGVEALTAAVQRIWGATFLPRTLDYFLRRGVKDIAMAVLIQPVILADVTGALSTRPPASAISSSWRTGERLVNAARGLGSPVHDGEAALDVLRLAENGDVVSSVIAEKTERLAFVDGRVRAIPDPEDPRSPALSPRELAALAALARKLENVAPQAAHLTFGFAGDQLVVFSARPAESRGYPEGGDAETVWSRVNAGESLPSVVTPLTWSLTDASTEASLRRAFQRLGCTVPKGARLLSNVHGRAYLNLSALMRVAMQVPGIDPENVVHLAGATGLEVLERQARDVSRRSFYTRLPLTVARLVAEQTALASDVEAFLVVVEDARRELADIDLAILPDDALVPTLRDVRTLLVRAGTTLSSATSAYVVGHLVLRTLLARSFPVLSERMAQALTSGISDLSSTRVALDLADAANAVRDDAAARGALESVHLPALIDIPPGPGRRALARFLVAHGDRAHREAELREPRWSEDPTPVMAMVRALLRVPALDPRRSLGVARKSAERELAGLERRLPFLELGVLRTLVDRTRRFSELRERTRDAMARVLSMVRTVVTEVDRRVRRVDPKLETDAAFLCTFDELLTAVATGRPDVSHLVWMRRAERLRDLGRIDPPMTFVGAPPPLVLPPTGDVILRGVPAGGGSATGKARVIHGGRDPADVRPGEILVIKSADVALSPLFLVAGGIVTELGGPLTHGAVVARALGIPMVVHVPGATLALRTGDDLRLDGDGGVVERVGGTR